VPAALLAAVLVGLALGALGGGGSILTVPALVHLLGQDVRTATTGSLVVVGITALVGAVPHARAGRVRATDGLVFGATAVGGAYVGSRASVLVPGDVLLVGFAGLMVVVAGLLARRLCRTRRASDGPVTLRVPGTGQASSGDAGGRRGPAHVVRLVATATGVGLLTGLFGVGGGFVVVPALVLVMGLPAPVAVGTSLVAIAVTSVAALATRLGQVTLDWTVLGAFTAVAVAASLLGARAVGRVSPMRLQQGFVVLLVSVALYTGATGVAALA
jgi:uncharacterized membrane protein YfcA